FPTNLIGKGSGIASLWYAARVEYNDNIYMEMGRSLYNELDKLDPSNTGRPRKDDSELAIDREDVRYNINVLSTSDVAINYQNLSQDEFKSNDILLVGKYIGIENRPLMNDVQIF